MNKWKNRDDPVKVKSLKLLLKCHVFSLFQCLHTLKTAQNTLEKNQKVYIPRYEHKFCDDTMVMGSHVKLLFYGCLRTLPRSDPSLISDCRVLTPFLGHWPWLEATLLDGFLVYPLSSIYVFLLIANWFGNTPSVQPCNYNRTAIM